MPRFTCTLSGNSLTIVDNYRNFTVASIASLLSGQGSGLTTSVAMKDYGNGCDLEISITNATGSAKTLGVISLEYFNLEAASVVRRNMRSPLGDDTVAETQSAAGGLHYPGSLYCPAYCLTSRRYHVGVSIQYDKASYGHGVEIWPHGGGSDTGRHGFFYRFISSSPTTNYTIPNGSTYTYTVSIRFALLNEHWLRTLLPYQAHHLSTQGKVRYKKDGRPVMAWVSADLAYYNVSTNPRSFTNASLRPDTNGFGPEAATIKSLALAGGYKRIMKWTAAGCQTPDVGLNYPPRFFTGIDESGYSLAQSSVDEFQSIPAAGIQMGFYWGSSDTYQPTWDSQSGVATFDPSNSSHKAQAQAEMAYVREAGGTCIGLDAFAFRVAGLQTPIKRALDWFTYLQGLYPGVKFIGEALVPDYLHCRMGNFFTINPAGNPASEVGGPWALADFLNPGHETWCQFLTYPGNLSPDLASTIPARRRYLDRLMSFGFTPICAVPVTPPTSGRVAADCWKTHYPKDLIPTT